MTLEERIRVALEDDADGGRLPLGFSDRVVRSLPRRGLIVRWRLPLAAASAAAVIVVAALLTTQLAPVLPPTSSPSPAAGSPPAAVTTGSPTQGTVPPNRIDLLTSISGVSFDRAWTTRAPAELDGIPSPSWAAPR